jgi:branched-chain amino acid transport system permease protein
MLVPTIISALLNGLILGLIYSLITTGVSLIYGIMKVSNFAHGEFYMIGAYASYFATTLLKIPTFASLPFSLVAGFVSGYAVERFLISDVYKKKIERPGEYAMLMTLGLSILFQNIIREFYSPFMKSTPPILPGTVPFYLISISWDRVLAAIISVITLTSLYLLIGKTKIGRAWRATAQNKVGALLTGVNMERQCHISYGVGTALAALAGYLLAPLYGIYPSMGFWPLTISFVAMTLGGLGSIEGGLIAGIIVGLAHSFTASFVSPSYADVGMYVVLIIVILIRPTGLFGRKD